MNAILAQAALTESNAINAVVWLAVLGVFLYLVYWLMGKLKVPEPLNYIIMAIISIAIFVICARILFKFAGNPF
jgi:uncharacterized MnhB-related membrane protein